MSREQEFPPDAALEDLASEWLFERAEGFTPERAQAFADWRNQDPRHAAAVRRVERTLALLDELSKVSEAHEGRVSAAPTEAATTPRGRVLQFPRAWRVAAAAALAFGALAWWQLEPRPVSGERIAADATAHRVALRDGSIVELNAASELRVDFSERERRIDLSTGEAHFQVAPNTARPFVVMAGDVAVRAVGTAFNVRRAGKDVEVLVFEGRVEVTRAGARAQLAAGDRTHIAADSTGAVPRVEKAAPANIREALAWQDPMTTFNDVPLREVVARLNQRNVVQFVLADEQLGERKIGGVIALNQPDAFVRLLEQGGDIAADVRRPDEIVLRRMR